MSEAPTPTEQDQHMAAGCMAMMGFGFVVLLAVMCSGGDEDRGLRHDGEWAAIMCQRFVRNRLKAPSTAKFQPSRSAASKKTGEARYTVTSYVDAQNSFGAMMRNTYTCDIEYTGGLNWSLRGLEIETP